jgi:dTDP-4-amino-4,6-dideoxygalactose transaminase
MDVGQSLPISSLPAGRTPRRLDDLAVFGGSPAFTEPRHVGRPNLGDRSALFDRIEGALDRGWLANDGPLVAEFERRVAELVEVEHCVATSSATTGLQLVARALELDGEVVMPSFTFAGTAHALGWLGITPVFADIDPATHNIDPDAVARAITPRTSAILAVHVWGRGCDVPALERIAQRHGIPLVLDAAPALGCTHAGQPIGGFGRAEVFSFHATKIASAGEGGVVSTHDPELARRLRLMRNFGFVDYDTVTELGTNAKMHELSAAMGLTSLDSLDRFIAVARDNHEHYVRELDDVPGLRLIEYPADERQNYHYVVAEVDDPSLRDDLVAVLHAEHVLARRYFAPGCHRMQPYSSTQARLPATEALSESVLVLPTGTAIGDADIAKICAIIRVAAEHAPAVRQRLTEAGAG